MAGYKEFWQLQECLYDDEGYSVEDAPLIGPMFFSAAKLKDYMEENKLEHNVNCVVAYGLTYR